MTMKVPGLKKLMSLILALTIFAGQVEPMAAVLENIEPHQEEMPKLAADEELVFGDYTYTISNGTAMINSYTGTETDVVIPEQIDGIPVTVIGEYAFRNCVYLKSIDIAKSIKEIQDYAFFGCSGIEEMIFTPDESLEIGNFVFSGMTSLKTIELLGNTKSIDGFYRGLDSLERLVIGKEVEYVNFGGLYECSNLKEIIVEEGNLFYSSENNIVYNKEQTSLILYPQTIAQKHLIIPSNITRVEEMACYGNLYLEEVTIGDSVTYIGGSAFGGCSYLRKVNVSSSVTEIDGKTTFSDSTIWGEIGSVAHNFAVKQGMAFIDSAAQAFAGSGKETTSDAGYSDWDGSTVEEIIPINNTYIVENGAQLAWIAQQTNSGNTFMGDKVLLAADIDLSECEWIPIGDGRGPFEGKFDGQNHTIYNMTVSGKNTNNPGLFGSVRSRATGFDVVIENIYLENVTITDVESSDFNTGGGALIGYLEVGKKAEAIVRHCFVDGVMDGYVVGGAIGTIRGGYLDSKIVIEDVNVIANLTTNNLAGGIVGQVTQYGSTWSKSGDRTGLVRIAECNYKGNLKGTGKYGQCAGILSQIDPYINGICEIEKCRTEGKIESSTYVPSGGIIAMLNGTQNTVKNCVNYASIDGGYYVGGIVGENWCTIEQCYNNGYIRGTAVGTYFGGIAGYNNGTIFNCHNSGQIAGGSLTYNGGITGRNNGTIENAYSVGELPNHGSSAVSVSWPGAMSSIATGVTKYCYYDKSLSETVYLYGTLSDTQDIINDLDLNITHSGGLTSAEMRTAACYRNWDFEKIWEIDYDYCGGYPILREIKDLLKKHPEESWEQENNFKITVVDQDGEPVSGASVTCGSESKPTDNKGAAEFDYLSDDIITLKAEKEGYSTYFDDDFSMNPTLQYRVRLVANEKISEHALSSVTLTYNKNHYELLTQTKDINKAFGDEHLNFVIKALQPDQVAKFSLYQGDYLVYETTNEHMNLPANSFNETSVDGFVKKTKIVVTYKDGTTAEEYINLNFVDERDQETEMEFGDKLTLKVGDEIPLLGGTTLSIDTIKLPINFAVSDEKWKISMNILEKERGEAAEVFKSEFTVKKKIEQVRKYMEKGTLEIGKNPKITAEIVGYAEGDMPMKTNRVKMMLYGQIKVEISKEVQVSACVFAVEVKGTVKASGEIEWDEEDLTIDGNMKIGGDVAVSAFLGFGVADLASAGFYGTGAFHMNWYLLPKTKTGLDYMYLDADLKVVLRFLGSNAAEYQLLGPWRGYIYSREKTEYSLRVHSPNLKNFIEELNVSQATMLSNEVTGEWNGSESMLQKNAWTISEPILMNCDGDIVMLFISNMVEGRAEEDVSVLMYSVYDATSKTWSSPKVVADDRTADFNPSAKDGYVVWNNAKTTLSGENTYESLGEKQEVAIAKYNSATNSFEQTVFLTDNSVYENNLHVSAENGQPEVVWTTNTQGDVFGVNGGNQFYISSFDGTNWNTAKLYFEEGTVLNTNFGMINNRACVVYTVDENDNLADNEGQKAYAVFADNGEKIQLTESNVRYAWISKMHNKWMWIGSDGIVYSRTDAHTDIQKEMETGTIAGTIESIAEDEFGNITILYIVNGDYCSNVYCVTYDAEANIWSQAIPVTQQEDYAESASGVYLDEEFLIAYNQRAFHMDSENLNGTNNICWMSIESEKAALSDVEVDFYKWDVAPGDELPILVTVSNKGMKTVEQCKVVIKDDTKEYFSQVVELSIVPGETKTVPLAFTLPNQIAKKDYTIELTPISAEKQDAVSATFTVGESYYTLDRTLYCVGGKTTIVISVRNIGFEPGNGTIEIFDNTDSDGIYETFDFTDLEYGKVLNYSTSVENLDYDSFAIKTLGIKVTKDGKDAGEMRTITIFQNEEAAVTGVILDKSHIHFTAIGDTMRLTATVLPKEGISAKLVWTSSNPQVVSVDQDGTITALQSGAAIVRVATEDGAFYAQCRVTSVDENAVPGPNDPIQDKLIPFIDVAKTDWFYDAVAYNYYNGLMTGMDDTHFGPYGSLSRAQFALILYRMEGSHPVDTDKTFGDLSGTEWYGQAVLWAAHNGIVTGYQNGNFGPADMITREQMAVMMYRYAKYLGRDVAQISDYSGFLDAASVSLFAAEAIGWTISEGIITGKDNGTKIDPQGNTARSEAAVIIQRFKQE